MTRAEAIGGDNLDTWLAISRRGGEKPRSVGTRQLALIQIKVGESSLPVALKQRDGAVTGHQSRHLSR